MFQAAKAGFDEAMHRWYNQRRLLGSVGWDAQFSFIEKLKAGDFAGAGQMMGSASRVPIPRLDIMFSQADAAANIVLFVEAHEQAGSKSRTKVLIRGLVSPEELDLIRNVKPA